MIRGSVKRWQNAFLMSAAFSLVWSDLIVRKLLPGICPFQAKTRREEDNFLSGTLEMLYKNNDGTYFLKVLLVSLQQKYSHQRKVGERRTALRTKNFLIVSVFSCSNLVPHSERA
jgi:hypothetical protein